MKKSLSSLSLVSSLLISGQALADDFSIVKVVQPYRMLVLSSTGGHTLEQYPILSLDLPYSSQLGTITGISYDSTSFSDSSSETAELCYHLAYQNNPVTCQAIIPNFTGEVTAFNGLGFRNGVKVSVHHRVEATGSFHYLQPTKEESITFHYTVD